MFLQCKIICDIKVQFSCLRSSPVYPDLSKASTFPILFFMDLKQILCKIYYYFLIYQTFEGQQNKL